MCEGPTEDYYFEVFIRLEPSNETDMMFCVMADQFLLGNDLNQLLLDFGVGDTGVDEDIIFLRAQVCPKPTTTTKPGNNKASRKRLLRKLELQNWGFVYTGGAGCRYCLPDNYDRTRSLRQLNDWFTNTFAPPLSATMEAAILSEIVPVHPGCLGVAPNVTVEFVQVSLSDLKLQCYNGKLIESLETFGMDDVTLTKHKCHKCVKLDFSKFGDNAKIDKGTWIKDQFKSDHGLTITSIGGYSPESHARIFDTGDAECVNVDGSRDFGSPNVNCNGGGGLGVGKGGEQGMSGENCKPVGNALIVQESDKACPDSSSRGGAITFTWDEPVLLSDIGLMDVDEDKQRIKVKYADGVFETFAYTGFGNNAVQRVIFGKMHVISVEVIFPGTGAVTELNFCPDCRPRNSHDKDHHCLFTEDGTTIKAQEVVYYEDFDQDNDAHLKWDNGILASPDTKWTRYLGDYGPPLNRKYPPPPYKTFEVDSHAAGVIIDLDFYEVGVWSLPDGLIIYVEGEAVDIGSFDTNQDENWRGGTTPLGIEWTLRSSCWTHCDGEQDHHIKIMVPKSSGLYASGKFRLLMAAQMKYKTSKSLAGYDNIKVTAVHECH